MIPRRYLIFGGCAFILAVAAIGGTSPSVAIPEISISLGASMVSLSWVLFAQQISSIGVLPLAGKAGDVFGRKRVFLASLSLFTTASLLCALSTNIQMLILFRVIQGIGSAGLLPSAIGLVAAEFPQSRQQTIGLFTTFIPSGMLLGPGLGGWLVSGFGWRSLFWLHLPFGLVGLIAAGIVLSESRREKISLDILGASLLTGSLLVLIAALSNVVNSSISLSFTFILFLIGACLFGAFIYREKRVAFPIIDLSLLKGRYFIATNTYNFLFGLGSIGLATLIPFYLVSVFGKSTMMSGIIPMPRSIGSIIASATVSFFLIRWGYRRPLVLGPLIIALAMLFLGLELGRSGFNNGIETTLMLAGIALLLGIGTGIASPAANNACIDLIPDRIGTITAIRDMFRQTGSMFGILSGSLWLEKAGDLSLGFSVLFFGTSAVMLFMVPLALYMPKKADLSIAFNNSTHGQSY
jgi:MFS family permease